MTDWDYVSEKESEDKGEKVPKVIVIDLKALMTK